MTKGLLVVGGLTAVILAGAASANTIRYFSGTECEGGDPGDQTKIGRHNEGCSNEVVPTFPDCESAALVVMPISANNDDDVNYDNIQLRYYDGSTSYQVTCAVGTRNAAGTTYSSGTQSSSAAGTGDGTFTWSTSTGTTALPNGGNTITDVQVQHVYCYLSSKYVGGEPGDCDVSGSYSLVRNYRIDAVGS